MAMNGDFLQKVIKSIREIDEDLVQLPEDLADTPTRYYVSTQIPTLDLAIGRPGVPSGKVTLFYGSEGHGKSTVAYHLLAEAQKSGGVAVLLDTEFAYDPERARRIGIENSSLILVHPTTIEEAFEVIEKVIQSVREESTAPLVIVWDSLAATPANTELEKKDRFYDLQPGQQAKVLSSAMRKIIRQVAVNDVVLLLVNQVRENVGVLYGPKEIMPGGRAIKFYASLIVRIRRDGFVEEDGRKVGITCVAEVEKNKVSAPFKEARFIIDFQNGVDIPHAYLLAAVNLGLVSRSGGWYTFAGDLQSFGSKKFRESDWRELFSPEVKDAIDARLWGGCSNAGC
jgi:recombination protein RecA